MKQVKHFYFLILLVLSLGLFIKGQIVLFDGVKQKKRTLNEIWYDSKRLNKNVLNKCSSYSSY